MIEAGLFLFHERGNLSFTVIGVAAPQGSKTKTRWGVREDNPRTKPWRLDVREKAVDAVEMLSPGYRAELWAAAVEVRAVFWLPRPQAHYRTGAHSGELKPNAPLYCPKKFDLDKLCRAVGDSLTATVLRDDVQIVHWDPWKLYGEPARCEITVAVVGSLPPFSPPSERDAP